MAGYDFDPLTEEERRRAQKQFWQAFGFALLSNSQKGREWEALGRAGLAGMGARSQSEENQQQEKLRKLQGERMMAENRLLARQAADADAMTAARQQYLAPSVPGFAAEDREGNAVQWPAQPGREDWIGYQKAIAGINPQMAIGMEPFARRQAVRQALAGAPAGSPAELAGAAAAGGGTPEVRSGYPLPGAPAEPPNKASMIRTIVARTLADAEKLRAAGLTEEADAMVSKAQSLLPQIKEQKVLTQDGRRVVVNLYTDGSMEVAPFAPDLEKAHFTDEGGRIVPRDPFTAEPRGAPIPKTATQADTIAWYNATKPQIVDGQAVTIGKGGAVTAAPIAGYQKPVDATTARAIAESRVQSANIATAIDLVRANPQAFGPKNAVGELAMQYLDEKGVEARSVVANIGSKKIHDRSGAAVTMAEMPRLKPFIPSATDKPSVVERKLTLLAAEEAAIQAELARGARVVDAGNAKPLNRAPLAGKPDTTPDGWKAKRIN